MRHSLGRLGEWANNHAFILYSRFSITFSTAGLQVLDGMIVAIFKHPNIGITGIDSATMQAAFHFRGKYTIAKFKFTGDEVTT